MVGLILAGLILPLVSQAGIHWRWREVGWRISRFQNSTSATAVRIDTSFAHVGPVGLADTSQFVQLDHLSYAFADSATAKPVAYWVFASDTSAVYTASLTALTVATDCASVVDTSGSASLTSAQRLARQDQNTGVVDPGTSKLVTTGSKVVSYPIFLGQYSAQTLGATEDGAALAMPIRCRVTAGVGAQGLAQARVFIVYQVDE